MIPDPAMGEHPAFDHVAVVHEGVGDLPAVLEPNLAAMAPTDHVIVALDDASSEVVAAMCATRTDSVARVSADDRYRRPTGAMRALHDFTEQATRSGASRVWAFGRIEFDDDDLRWRRYEAAVDDVLGHLPFVGMCLYDARQVEPDVLDMARRTHRRADRPATATATATVVAGSPRWLPSEPPVQVVDATEVAAARAAAGDLGRAAGLGDARLDELRIVTSELATNATRHGAPPATVHLWIRPGEVVVQVSDHGPGIDDPWPELRPPARTSIGGLGLWIVGQLADRLHIERTATAQTVVTAALRA